MCGIIACHGSEDAGSELVDGLETLEYRGYDSAGIAVQTPNGLVVRKSAGGIDELQATVTSDVPTANIGIGHTRWSTHGPPTDANAHPHVSETGRVAVVHNGIIDNHEAIRQRLEAAGYTFASDTDTEVIPQLVEYHLNRGRSPDAAFRIALEELDGSYAVALIIDEEDAIYAARQASPLVLGIDTTCTYLASDVPAFLTATNRVIYLEDGDYVKLTAAGRELTDADGAAVDRDVATIDWDAAETGRGHYDHFMLKEINSQPTALSQTLSGRITDDGAVSVADIPDGTFTDIDDVQFIACGTSYHAALYGARQLTQAGIRTQVTRASEFTAIESITDETLVIAVTQSGETADTLSALRRARRAGARTLAVTNVVGSSITREAETVVYIHAGPEIGVAATKTFTSQVATITMLTHRLAVDLARGHPRTDAAAFFTALRQIPDQLAQMLHAPQAKRLSERYVDYGSYFFIGRGFEHPVALEGALKFKEITYEHAEGFAAGELKHGPLALVTDDSVVFALLTGADGAATLQNAEEARARGATIVAVAPEGRDVGSVADATLRVPDTHPDLAGLFANVHLQLIAYYTASKLGRPIDQPRNLAKSVTVE